MQFPAVAEDVEADHVDLAARVSEEGAEPGQHPVERPLPGRAGLVPVGVGDDQEEVLGVRSDVRLPDVLEVMVVGGGAATLDLGDDSAPGAQGVDEVGPCLGDKPVARGEDHLLPEAQVLAEHGRDDRLDRARLCAVDVDEVDLSSAGVQVRTELAGQVIDPAGPARR